MQNTLGRRQHTLLLPLVVGALALVSTSCGGDDDGTPAAADADGSSVDIDDDDGGLGDGTGDTDSGQVTDDDAGADAGDVDAGDVDAGDVDDVDLDTPPEPDASASVADHPDFEWAFESGYQTASGYGRADYYDPGTVSDPGSMAGLQAAEAYRDGFALGLADYEAEQAAAAARVATVLDSTIVGQVIRQGVGEDWVAETAGVEEECGAFVEAENPGVPCIARWRNADRENVIAVRLGDSGQEIDLALLVDVVQGGREVLAWWSRADGEPMPDWVVPWDGMPAYLQ